MIDRAIFFQHARPIFDGKLTPKQVQGIEVILDAWPKYGDGNLSMLAYILATTKWETAHTMQPIHERGRVSYFNKYEPGTAIGKRLGNTLKGDGYRYRGRGYVQLTGRRNYAYASKMLSVDFVSNPDLALDPELAARILIVGMFDGWFTGKGLNDYIDDVDESDSEDLREFVAARRTVNGTDKAKEIGAIALRFEAALKAAQVHRIDPEPPAPKTNWFISILKVIVAFFKSLRR